MSFRKFSVFVSHFSLSALLSMYKRVPCSFFSTGCRMVLLNFSSKQNINERFKLLHKPLILKMLLVPLQWHRIHPTQPINSRYSWIKYYNSNKIWCKTNVIYCHTRHMESSINIVDFYRFDNTAFWVHQFTKLLMFQCSNWMLLNYHFFLLISVILLCLYLSVSNICFHTSFSLNI